MTMTQKEATTFMYDELRKRIEAHKKSVLQSLENASSYNYETMSQGLPIFEPFSAVPQRGGVYALWCIDNYGRNIILYVGETGDLRRRIQEHYRDSSDKSPMKNKLDVFAHGARHPFYIVDEERLNTWMKANIRVSWAETNQYEQFEKYIIDALNPLLNEKHNSNPSLGVLSGVGRFNDKDNALSFLTGRGLSNAGL